MKKKEKMYTIEEIKSAITKAIAEPNFDEKEDDENKMSPDMKFSVMLVGIVIEHAIMHFLEEGEEK